MSSSLRTASASDRCITLIQYGVDVARFAPAAAAVDDGLPDQRRGPGLVRFGSFGRLQRVKD